MQLIGVVGFVLEKEKNRLPFQICSLSGCLWVLLLEMLQGSAYPLKLGTSLQKKKKKRRKQKHFFPTAIFKEEALLFLENKDLQFKMLCKSGLIQLRKIISS